MIPPIQETSLPKRVLTLCGNAMAAYMDVCVGTLIVASLAYALGIRAELPHLAIGALLSVLPDFDIVLPILAGQPMRSNHRNTLLHRPAFMVPLVALAGWLLGGTFWALAATLCVLWHYVHDTRGLSPGGIAWFWPLSDKYWSLAGFDAPQLELKNQGSWVRRIWLTPSVLSIREIAIGSGALLLASVLATSVRIGFLLVTFAWAVALALWAISARLPE